VEKVKKNFGQVGVEEADDFSRLVSVNRAERVIDRWERSWRSIFIWNIAELYIFYIIDKIDYVVMP